MRVIAFNGSPRKDGNCSILIGHVLEALRKEGDVSKDEEGLRTMRVLGENMGWLLRKVNG